MTVGIPGIGIGGLFYLVSALVMPFRELGETLRGRRPRRWRLAAFQSALAAAMMASLAVTSVVLGWVVGWVDPAMVARIHVGMGKWMGPLENAGELPTYLRFAALLFTLFVLTAVLSAVRLASLVVRRD